MLKKEVARLAAENARLKQDLSRRIEGFAAPSDARHADPDPTNEGGPTVSPTEALRPLTEPGSTGANPPPAGVPLDQVIHSPEQVAEFLGLEPARAAYFSQEYHRIRRALLEVERKRAQVTEDGGTIRVLIPPYPEEGRKISEDWTRHLATALTPEERSRYDRLNMHRVLFARDFGISTRRIEIRADEESGPFVLDERWDCFERGLINMQGSRGGLRSAEEAYEKIFE